MADMTSSKDDNEYTPLVAGGGYHRAWSLHDPSPLVGGKDVLDSSKDPSQLKVPFGASEEPVGDPREKKRVIPQAAQKEKAKGGFLYYLIYAIVNVIISVPGLYGYAAVIFNHEVYNDSMNALSKLVIFSSLVHQLGFCLFSSLDFAIGTVQDAGLIFLSSMSNTIANHILDNGGTSKEVISTAMVLLSLGTAMLGILLMLMGKFRLADAVSYLPMPVVGGYLAFIGYFCCQAGVALCISKPMIDITDWKYLADPNLLLLAIPGLAVGLLLTWISRKVSHPAALPITMVAVPAIFYVIIYATGVGIEGAREGDWVGPVSPPVPIGDLFKLVDFSLVHWGLIADILPTWIGMVFVVAFASCLDVAAIAMDMGEALDTNRELATVGICNLMSGLTFGYTGSYIFSQTIFTYRTGVHSRWIGVIIMCVFMYVVASEVNILEVAPLFFLGSTLIFIGYDLLYEWLVEIRHKIFWTEYAIVWATFISIQFIGIDAGIIFGVLVSVIEHVFLTARTLTVNRVTRNSKAVYGPEDYKLLQAHGYHPLSPKIVTLEIKGNIFFGSSLQLLEYISEEIGLNIKEDLNEAENTDVMLTPKHSSLMLSERRNSLRKGSPTRGKLLDSIRQKRPLRPPDFLVLDLTQVPNLDASAARGCFLQLAKSCAKKGTVVCAAGATPRIDWMLRAHDAAPDMAHEERIKTLMISQSTPIGRNTVREAEPPLEQILLFLTVHEALEFCENMIIRKLKRTTLANRKTLSFTRLDELDGPPTVNDIADVFAHILGLSEAERARIKAAFDDSGSRYHKDIKFKAGQVIYAKDTTSDCFYVVLRGAVAVAQKSTRDTQNIISGAGPVGRDRRRGGSSNLIDPSVTGMGNVKSFYPVGGVFGYVDFLLERPRSFRTVASRDDTLLAKIGKTQMTQMRAEEPQLDAVLQRVLLHASILDLASCTCE